MNIKIYEELRRRLGLPTSFSGMLGQGSAPDLRAMADHVIRSGALGDHYGAKPEGLTIDKLAKEFPTARWSAPMSMPRLVGLRASGGGQAGYGTTDKIGDRAREGASAGGARRPAEADRTPQSEVIQFMDAQQSSAGAQRYAHAVDESGRCGGANIADAAEVKFASATGTVRMQVELTADIVRGAVKGIDTVGAMPRAGGLRMQRAAPM